MMSDQLSDTLGAFELWRKNKPSKSAATPINLRQQAVALLSNYSKTTIAKYLSISGTQFNHWQQLFQPQSDELCFISLPPLDDISSSQPLSLEINLANGHQMLLSGDLIIEQLIPLLEAIKS